MRYVILVIVLLLIALAVSALLTFETGRGGYYAEARADAEQLRIYAKVYSQRHDSKRVEDLTELAAYSERGERGIIDPWGKQFQFRYVIDSKTGKEQFRLDGEPGWDGTRRSTRGR